MKPQATNLRKPRVSNPDPNFTQFRMENPDYPTFHAEYDWIFPTQKNCAEAAAKFGHVLPWSANDWNAWAMVDDGLANLFRPLRGNCRIVEPHDLKFNRASAGGILAQWMGERLKLGVFARNPYYISAFWKRAHLEMWPQYWKETGKLEIVKRKKIDAGDIRSFTFPDALYWASSAMMYQDQDDKMKEIGEPIAIGFTPYYGGAKRLYKMLRRIIKARFDRGDCHKYDRHVRKFLMMLEGRHRWMWWTDMFRNPNTWLRHLYIFAVGIHGVRILPNGQVLRKKNGNSSGDKRTSNSNTFTHIATKMYCFVVITGIPALNWLDHCSCYMYGDDYVEAVDADVHAMGYTPQRKVELYRDQGHELELEAEPETEDITMVEFLSRKIEIDPADGPIFKPMRSRKYLHSLEYPMKVDITIDESYTRAQAFRVECFYDPYAKGLIERYCAWCRKNGAKMTDLDGKSMINLGCPDIPLLRREYTDDEIRKLWTGREGVSFFTSDVTPIWDQERIQWV